MLVFPAIMLSLFLLISAFVGALPSLGLLLAGRDTIGNIKGPSSYGTEYDYEVDGVRYEGHGRIGDDARIDKERLRVSYIAFMPSVSNPKGSAPGRPYPHPWIWLGGITLALPSLVVLGLFVRPLARLFSLRRKKYARLRTWPAHIATVTRVDRDDQATASQANYRSSPAISKGTAFVTIDDSETSFEFEGPPLGAGGRVTGLCDPEVAALVVPLRGVAGGLRGTAPVPPN